MNLTTEYVLKRGVEEIVPTEKALAELMDSKKITLYQGFDPTADSLHIGHFIGVRKLAQFQKLGHKVIFLIGDFTAMIGDPTDKKAARTVLTKEQVLSNLRDYQKQVSRIIDFEGENKAEIKFNSEWLAKLSLEEILNLSSNFTVQQMIERDMFQERIKDQKPIHLHEFFYPLMVGYDSVVMEVDLEIGGSDQFFNMLAGRTLMRTLKHKDKHVLTMKLLTDQNGIKMGKTDGNAIFLKDSGEEIFGKIMSWPDSFILSAVELLTDVELGVAKELGPMDLKKQLAEEVVTQIYGKDDAKKAREHFENTFQKGEPEYSERFRLDTNLVATIAPFTSNASGTQAKQLITQRAVQVNGDVITDFSYTPKVGDKIKVGARTFGTVVENND